MDLSFVTSGLRAECNSRAELLQRWGEERADAVAQRLQELDAAACLGDVADLPYLSVRCDGSDSKIEIQDVDGLVIEGTGSASDSTVSHDGSWQHLTSLTISNVIAGNAPSSRRARP